ncbi:MAG TPA: hypothetical protein VMH27_01295 [Puia sp.]|nr:hypothetical protein [Puia sp.]
MKNRLPGRQYFFGICVSFLATLLTVGPVSGHAQGERDTADLSFWRDSVNVAMKRLKPEEKAHRYYEMSITNLRSDPICIMHSAHGFLQSGAAPLRLALFNTADSFDIFNFGWVEEDTVIDDNYPNPNYNAEPILPQQSIKFRILFSEYLRPRRIILEYIILGDFCYKEFKRAIYQNAATWYDGKVRKKFVLNIP